MCSEPHSPDLLHDLGRFMARVDCALQSFQHPAMHRIHLWDTTNLHFMSQFVEHIKPEQRRKMVSQVYRLLFRFALSIAVQVIGDFVAKVLPILPTLQYGLIHNDGNDHNIVLSDDQTVSGIIDFGDMVLGPYVMELAVTITYGKSFAQQLYRLSNSLQHCWRKTT